MQYLPIILFTIIALYSVIRPFTVLFHELGHAIPAILFSREKVTIYIGSYGDPKGSIHFTTGLIEIWFKYNPLSWRLGLCVPSSTKMSINQQIIYTLTGPLTSFTIAVVACYFTFTYNLHGAIKLILVFFLGSSFFDLIINLVPEKKPVQLYDGRLTYNDGYKLKLLFYYKRFAAHYAQTVKLYDQQKYSEVVNSFNTMLAYGLKDENIYRLAISSNLQLKNYNKAKELVDEFIPLGKMDSDDFANAGLAYSHLQHHTKAMEFYDESLKRNPNNKYSLNNKGFTLNLMERYDEAIPFFDKSIEIDKAFAYSYNNRGLAKIKTGKPSEGLADINYAFSIDKNNSYGYRNLGIYHLDKGESGEAIKFFRKAKELDNTTHLIDELIDKAEQHAYSK